MMIHQLKITLEVIWSVVSSAVGESLVGITMPCRTSIAKSAMLVPGWQVYPVGNEVQIL